MNYREKIGRATWKFLHTLGEGLDDHLDSKTKLSLKLLMSSLATSYPCKACRYHFEKYIEDNELKFNRRRDFRRYICKFHNFVNKRLNKEVINNCDLLN